MKMVKVDNENESEVCLNSDIIFDILSRIPAKPLLSMKCVSKVWKNIISNCSFIKAQLQNAQLDLNGFIFQDGYMLGKYDRKTVSYIPVESKNAAKVYQGIFKFLQEDVAVLATYKGIFCCRSCLPSLNPTIYVCNPLNEAWIKLEWSPPFDIKESIALVFDFEPSKFKLVRVRTELNNDEDEEDFFFTFELYCSETKTWRKSAEICNCKDGLIKNRGIYAGGFLHWLTEGDQILTFDVEKETSLLIPVPLPHSTELGLLQHVLENIKEDFIVFRYQNKVFMCLALKICMSFNGYPSIANFLRFLKQSIRTSCVI
ncbi:F-box protein At5g65850-like [Trifolium pratense]|uniref:F-box protein At5g65850-like n=1 Tax=Trifolium pratense TaxID=57577 RepID=UPI001E691BB9|nr:F-box protein At5g65850-like [Trifolium pratense]